MVQEWSGGPPEGPGGFVRPIQSSLRGRRPMRTSGSPTRRSGRGCEAHLVVVKGLEVPPGGPGGVVRLT